MLNIICLIKHITLERKPLHVFNNIFWTKLYDTVRINLFIILQKYFFSINLLSVQCRVQVKFKLLNKQRTINLLNILLSILSKNVSKNISLLIVVLWCKLCVHTRENGDAFQDINSRRDCAIARHYKIIYMYMSSALIICLKLQITLFKSLEFLSLIKITFYR